MDIYNESVFTARKRNCRKLMTSHVFVSSQGRGGVSVTDPPPGQRPCRTETTQNRDHPLGQMPPPTNTHKSTAASMSGMHSCCGVHLGYVFR